MWYDYGLPSEYEVTKCGGAGVSISINSQTFSATGISWNHNTVTEWGSGCKVKAAEIMPITAGTHPVRVSVTDNLGNVNNYDWSFSLGNVEPVQESLSYYAPWYDSKPENGMTGNWILASNLEDEDAAVAIYIGDELMVNPDYKPLGASGAVVQYGGAAEDQYTFIIPAHGRITPQFADKMAGPVRVVSLNGNELLVSQRVLFKDSFNEVMAVRESDLDDTYYFTWYDSLPQNFMNGNWILVGNTSENAAADVYISIGGQVMTNPNWQADGAADQYTYKVEPGGIITPSFPNTMAGPVIVKCTNCDAGHNIFASQRVIFKDSFSEVMGTPEKYLDDEYYFTLYDSLPQNHMNGNWVLVGNTGPDDSATINIEIGGKRMKNPLPGNPDNEDFTIPAGGNITPQFPGTMDGPVKVACSAGSTCPKLFASQRVIFKNSFEEVQGTAVSQLGNSAVFSWYDLQSVGMNDDWILVGNVSGDANAAAQVYIDIGGQSATGDAPLSVYGQHNVTPQFNGMMDGPVMVTCPSCSVQDLLIVMSPTRHLQGQLQRGGRASAKGVIRQSGSTKYGIWSV